MCASSALSPHRDPRVAWRTALVLLVAVALSLGGYLLASEANLRTGFPLDDAWIHQTYARNLALGGEWAFIPGEISGGSTSPLWTVLLALGHALGVNIFVWTFALGGVILFTLAYAVEMGVQNLVEGPAGRFPWVGLVIAFEWHFVWAAVSGMETLLHALFVVLFALLLTKKKVSWLWLGILTGLSVWVRPDGLTLLGPLMLTAMLLKGGVGKRMRAVGWALVGFGLLFLPYLWFNFQLTGQAWPTTFYAKQAEYVAWQARPLLGRLAETALQFLAGAAIVLLPAVVFQAVKAIRQRNWAQISLLVWMLGYVGIYLMRLPAYQHGRYLIPAMTVFFLMGLYGLVTLVRRGQGGKSRRSMVLFAWVTLLVAIGGGFWMMGMRSYQEDVEFIETEMVDTARWVAGNIPPGALIAAHDIGALGYFDQHRLVDLAGLISPEVIPFLRDDAQMSRYLDEMGVEYLVAFPDWYTSLTADLEVIHTTSAEFAPAVGMTNLTVFRWTRP